MAWGVLEDQRDPWPPGTIILRDDNDVNQDHDNDRTHTPLKKHEATILQPQPTDSPNDPLNWSMKVKCTICLVVTITITTIAGIQSMLSTAGRILATQYGVSYPALIRTLQPPGIAAGAVTLFIVSAIGAVYGKRLPIVAAVLVVWIMMLVGYFASSLRFYQALNIILNVFSTAPELLSAPLIADVIYVHQRGKIIAFSSVVAIIGIDISGVVSGNIVASLGVRYLYIISFCVMFILLACNYLFMWETTYARPLLSALTISENVSSQGGGGLSGETLTAPKIEARSSVELSIASTESDISDVATQVTYAKEERLEVAANLDIELKRPFTYELRMWRGRLTDKSFMKALLQPFPLMIFPPVLFSSIVNGAMLTWVVISSIISAMVLLYPPYNLQPNILAYLSLPPSMAALISSLVSGYASDWMIKYMARKNGGVYEPEFRLLLLLPAVVISTVAFLLLGPLYHRHAPVYQIVLANTLFSIAMPFGSTACTTYILDTIQDSASEAFVATTLVRSIFTFLATFYVPGWFAQYGALHTYRALAILNGVVGLAAIPMYMLGKRWRAVTGRSVVLRRAANLR